MKKTLLTALVLVGLSFSLNAQASNTFKGSSGTFKTFTDTYMDVQYFTTQDYPKDFGYISSESTLDGYPTLELSYAHQFKKTKFGLYVDSGLLPNFHKETQGETGSNSISSGRSFAKFFWGFSNHGLSLSFGGNLFNSTLHPVTGTDPTQHSTSKEIASMTANITWGGSFDTNNFSVKPIVSLNILSEGEYNYESTTDQQSNSNKTTETNHAPVNIVATLGTIFDLKPTNALHHEIGVNAKGGYAFGEDTESHNSAEITKILSDGFIIGLDADYKLTYSIEDKLQLALRTGLNTSFVPITFKPEKSDEVLYKTFDMTLSPFVNFGLIYNIKPDVVSLVLGTDFNVPHIIYHKDMDKDNKDLGHVTSFTSMNTNVNAGINWNFNKNVGMDASIMLPISPVVGEGFKFSLGITLQK